MRTNIEIDDALMQQALNLTGIRTKRGVVDLALRELVQRRQRKDLLDLVGKVEFHEGYDYKEQRRTRYDAD
jgi:Arc/MetJ family transcription regulator